jgi:DNA-directed RNA polymerase specialized sigma24 family protein
VRNLEPKGAKSVDPISDLEREWQAIAPGELARAFPAWQQGRPALRRFASPARLLSFLQSSSAAETDAPLHALLVLAAGDRLAARLCLQAILPALKAQALRIAHVPERREELRALLLAHAWRAVCTYPAARSQRVAANVVLQVLHDSTRELRRLTSPASGARGAGDPGPVVSSLEQAGELAAPRPGRALGVEGLLAAAVAAAELDGSDAELILLTRVDAVPLRLVAASRGCSRDALLKRRQRAEARLRAHIEREHGVRKGPASVLTSGEGSKRPDPPESPQTSAVGPPSPGRAG